MDGVQKNNTAEWYREQGKIMFYHNNGDKEVRSQGIQYILKAHSMHDTEASFLVATLMLKKILKPGTGSAEERALDILFRLAYKGDVSSRRLLNRICMDKYNHSGCVVQPRKNTDQLVDFEGKPIAFERKGLLTPIDAELQYIDGKCVLQLSANIFFTYYEKIPNRALYERAVLDGIREWQGEYTVFGGQPLSVKINLTTEPKILDTVIVMSVSYGYERLLGKISDAVGTKASKARIGDIIKNKRSFATVGVKKWSVRSRKHINIFSEDGTFSDYNEIKAVAKHEFGHALGLGDLYYSPTDNFPGVEKGSYRELDSYYVSDKIYNLVMCDHHGPVSNNDIEMILLAFRDNKTQLYQTVKPRDKISEALGRGN